MSYPDQMNKKPETGPPNLDWPNRKQYRKSITIEIAVYISCAIILLMSIMGYIITKIYVETTTEDVVDKLLIQSRSYSNSAGKFIISTQKPDELMLNSICKKLASDRSTYYWVGIADQNGNLLAHTDISRVIQSGKLPSITSSKFGQLLKSLEQLQIRADTIFTSVPIMEGNIAIGRLATASSNGPIIRARRNSIITIVAVTVAMIFIGIPLAMILIRRKLRSIKIITNNLQQLDVEKIALNITIKEKNELGYLANTLNVMGTKLNLAQQKVIENERMAKELEIAREIQKNILPRSYPVTDIFEFAGGYKSAREVGGDYYDFIDFDDDHIGYLVADVSGKSLPGMLNMLLTRDIVKESTRSIKRPAELLKRANRELRTNIKKGTFVTMFFGLLNKKSGEFSFASAGHNPLIKLENNGGDPILLKTKGYPLGLMPPEQFDSRIETSQINLREGDVLVQYTDGINEALNDTKTEFGMDRFLQALRPAKEQKAGDITSEVLGRLDSFVGRALQYDDITIVVLKWFGKTQSENKTKNAENIYAKM